MSRTTRTAAITAAVVALLAAGTVAGALLTRHHGSTGTADASGSHGPSAAADTRGWTYERAGSPARTLVHDRTGALLATFTDGSRTVDVTAAARTFSEPEYTKATVTVDVAVRLAPQPWHDGAQNDSWFATWLGGALTDTSPDALAVAFQYVQGAPDLYDAKGVRYAGDAQFGPYSSTDPDGRAENNDFYDFLGITYDFSDGTVGTPKPDRYGDVDCSGFLRLVYGYRLGYPLRNQNTPGDGLPRRAVAMSKYGPGTETGHGPGDLAGLQPGDLVFFNVDPSDGPQADHSGIFLGTDSTGHYRFISSRTLANGPTMGDSKYAAILDGDGHFASAFVNARRL
jgi:cell wall-associated NlpC family hydrolase